jgi:DNA-binding transcriptional LysR family regulator
MERRAADFPTPHQFALVAAVAEHRGFTAAARALRISQPSLTAQVQSAERALGIAMFARTSEGVRLTDAGRLAVAFARRHDALRRDLLAGVAALDVGNAGSLILGASTAVGEHYIPDALVAFRAAYPGVAIEMRVGNSTETLERLRARAVDVAIMALPREGDGLLTATLFTDRIVPFAPDASPLARGRADAEAVARATVITREEGSDVREQGLAALRRLGCEPARVTSLATNLAVIRMIQAGFGDVGILSESAVAPHLAEHRLARLRLPGWRCARTLGIVRVAGADNALVRRFWAFVTEWVRSAG